MSEHVRIRTEEGVLLSPIPITDQQASVISPGLTASLVKQDQSLKIPDIPIERSLSRDSIELTQPVGAHLLDLVPSAELRRLIDASFLRRLNPWFDEFSDDKILAADEGIAVMPMEQWALTTAVPVTDLDLSTSPLWVIQRKYPGVSIVTREAFVEFSGAAAGPPALPAEPTDCNEFKDETQHQVECECALLQKARDSWLAQVRFPSATSIGAQRYRQLTETPVRVGVLEQRTTLIHDHRVFTASDHPAWYGFDILGDLVPNPVGQSAANRGMERLNPRSFSTSSHHGSHVAALLGGRQSECWSGLLPSARLVLVDLSDFAKVSRALDRSVKAFVQVFNVSQRFVEDENATKTDPNASYYRWLTKEIEQHKSALWVVAAGNDGRDLNGLKGGDVPLPAGWNPRHNVLVVTASDANGDIPESEVNHGKRYVDLVGVGKDVVSATEQNQYGPASGTSQATPQVAAAAATLVDRLGPRLSPGDVKARLIATAEWKPHYEGNVWGGRLDFDAAASFPDRDILVTTTSRASRKRYAVVVNDDARVEILNAPHYYERVGAAGATAPESILFSRILSLRKLSEGGFRVVLREPEQNHLKILLNAQLADADGDQRIRCASFEVFDPEADAFIPDEGCDHGLSVETIDSYFQGGAYQINWESIDE